MKKIIMAILGGILVVPSSVFAANVTDTGPGQAGDVLYYTGPAGNDQGTWSSLPSLVQTIINNNTVVPATVGTSLNSGAVSTVGNVDVTGTGITQTVTGSGATGVSSYDFSNLSTVEGQTNATNISNLTTTVNGNSTDISNLQTTVSNHTTQISTLNDGLAQEVIDRTNGDAVNATAISNETTRATGAETVLGQSIVTETNRATGAETTLSNNINTVDANSVARDNVLQGNIDKEASTRASADQALQDQINHVNAQAQDNTNRIDRLEQTKYLLEPTVRLYDSKYWQVQAFDSYDVRHGANFALGARVMLKLGKSYEEKLLAKTNPEIARLLAANVSHDIAERDAIRKQLAEDRALITEQAALLKQVQLQSADHAVIANVPVKADNVSKVLPSNDEDLLNALDSHNDAFASK